MQIIHVSSFPITRKSPNLHAVSIKLSNGLTRNGHNVLNVSDRDVARMSAFGYRRLGTRHANRVLREICEMHRPDLLLLGHADVISPETVAAIRRDRPALRVIQWNVDPLFEPDNVARINAKLDVVDATLISTAGAELEQFRRPGHLVGFLPNPVDFSIETARNHERAELPFEVFYACRNPAHPPRCVFGRDWNMNEFCAQLQQLCPELRMTLPGIAGRPPLKGYEFQQSMCEAGIGLNISRRPDSWLYSSDRLAQLAGNGMVVAMERGTGYETLFTAKQMLFASSLEELATGLRALAADPAQRMAMATAGRARYHELFNERIVARYIEQVAAGPVDPRDYEWPTLLPG
ncbi:glycosyltransferase family protein [Acidocella aromatica]|uniref:Spore protein YkvP/CgeB glycosyl transferase-like domain-containing protein n=1 Tax=Acidocella aromatica TaxID=1303579 RepID=A0A840VG25_9PROT|nr:glycosyltransferase [Acidocella aromatica]MBB5372165.1 hypothetical protein [Acidocella aromatica]